MPQIEIQSVLPWGWAGLALLLLAGYLAYYYLWCQPLPKVYRLLITTFRGLFLLVLFLLLLDLKVNWSRPTLVPPRIGIFLDNSLSMSNHPAASATTIYSQVITVVNWAKEHNYKPVLMTFGEKLTRLNGDRFEYIPEEQLTDFDLLEEVWQTGNLQAGFLFSDGVTTSGRDLSAIEGPEGVPIFTVGVGDTTSGPDLSITDLRAPLSLLAQEQGTIQVTVRGLNAAGERGRLYVFNEDELIYNAPVKFDRPDDVQVLEASVVGRLDAPNFRVELSVLAQEANIDNNRREFQIDVLPGRRTVTLLTGGLSPNTGLLSRWAREIRNTHMEQLYFLKGAWHGPEEWFWQTPQDLVILDNYPTGFLLEGHLDRLLEKLRRDRSAVIVIAGPDNTNLGLVRLCRARGIGLRDERNGVVLPQMRLSPGDAGPGSTKDLRDFPPSAVPYTLNSPRLRREAVLLKGVSNRPVIGFAQRSGHKTGVMLLPELAAINLKLEPTDWRSFLSKAFETMVEWSLEPAGFSPYVIQTDRRQYHLGEKVQLRGLIRDRAGTHMLQPVLTIEILGPENSAIVTMNYNFETVEYEAEFWPGEPGAHRIRVYDGASGGGLPTSPDFTVQAGRVELESLTQNRYGLQRLAESTGGSYVELGSVETLLARQAYTARTVTREYQFNLWRIRGLWIGLVLLLGLEWGLRRYVGLI
ncbi:MAG: hypothetical protein IIA60_03135 [Candidatus Marinimicrobia bacterium]|nr:hypothetical protein [Candidatus Neomarinimicrobiota bacterium]